MLILKKANYEDVEEEYLFTINTPCLENGYKNAFHDISREDFTKITLPFYINQCNKETAVSYINPMTTYFLWLDNKIIAMYQVFHKLSDFQKETDGHISYTVLKEYRQKGYGTKGLSLVLKEAKNYIEEDEIYMHAFKDNIASLKVMLNNGAYIYKETDKDYFTKIKRDIL